MKGIIKKTKIVAMLVIAGLLCSVGVGVMSAEESQIIYENPENIIAVTCNARGTCSPGKKQYTEFFYSDEWLLCEDNKNTISGELAKASVSLTFAAYEKNYIKECLDEMSYTTLICDETYDIMSTYEDNDRVAYTIANKKVKYNGEVYSIFLVPIRGTAGNCEWVSDFNIGTGDDHKGFYIAADIVKQDLLEEISKDNYDKEHTIIWTMGHSRGAAVANIIAGELSVSESVAVADNIYAYTYACPNVSRNADPSLTNIFNFICPGDMVPLLPIDDWGFKRYGQSYELEEDDYDNFCIQFKRVTGQEYKAVEDSDIYERALLEVWPSQRNANYAISRTAMDMIALAMMSEDERGGTTMIKIVEKHLGPESGKYLINAILSVGINDGMSFFELNTLSNSKDTELIEKLDECIDEREQAFKENPEFANEYWKSWLNSNEKLCQDVYKRVDFTISGPYDLEEAKARVIDYSSRTGNTLFEIGKIVGVFFETGVNPVPAIFHGHTEETYMLWINSMYYGYKGWYNSDDKSVVEIDDTIKTIGRYCFFNCDNIIYTIIKTGINGIGEGAFKSCDNLSATVLADSVRFLEKDSYSDCTSLKIIALPIDIDYESTKNSSGITSPFCNVKVKNITYTYGQTGIMPDRQTNEYSDMYYGYTLEGMSSSTLESIMYYDGIKNIGKYAYFNCKALIDVDMPDSIEQIGCEAFSECDALQTISISNNVKIIAEKTFYSCDKLEDVTLPEGITTIRYDAFYRCKSLEEIIIPNTVTYIEINAFAECSSLKKVTIPVDTSYRSERETFVESAFRGVSVEEIIYTYGSTGVMTNRQNNEYAHMYHQFTLEGLSAGTLKTVTYEEGITNIGAYSLYGCGVLETVNMAESIKTIGAHAFNSCISIKDIDISNISTLGWSAFYNCDGLTEVKLISHVGELASSIYEDCDGLLYVSINEGITKINYGSFYHCDKLKEVIIPDTVTYMENNAFAECGSLKKVKMPVDITYRSQMSTFVESAFRNVWAEEITYTYGRTGVMPDRQSNQYAHMYYGYTLEGISAGSLKTITYEEGITNIGAYALYGCRVLETVNMSKSIEKIGAYAFRNCVSMKEIDVSNVLTMGNHAFYNCDGLTEVKIANYMGEITYGLYEECDGLESVNIGDGITIIREAAFYECDGLKEIVIPDSVTHLEKNAFGQCRSLRKVTMPVDITYRATMGTFIDSSFNGVCVQEITYTYGSTGIMPDRNGQYSYMRHDYTLEANSQYTLKSIRFEDGIERIGNYVAHYCPSLQKVRIPESVTSIGANSFVSCGNQMTVYGHTGSYAQDFANRKGFKFVKLLHPYISVDNKEVNAGEKIQFTSTVYLDMDETTSTNQWSVSGNVSEGTSISDEGVLSVASDESAEYVDISATYNDVTEKVTMLVTKYDIVDGLKVSDKVKIEGYQISYRAEGSRVIGSVEPKIHGKNVKKWGFIYGFESINDVQNPVTAADMFIGTTNEFVAIYEVPGNGTSPRQLGESETATYYVQTMLFAEKNKTEFTARYKVRGYALLEDGTYVYSDVHDYSVYDISKEIYQNVLMNNLEGHEYLYNSILSIVDKTMEKIDFDINRNITN